MGATCWPTYYPDFNPNPNLVPSYQVHLACGLWGVIAAGFFTVPALYVEAYPRAPGDESDDALGTRAKACAGVLYGGNGSQLGANLTFLLLQVPWIVMTVGALFMGLQWHGILRVTSLVEKVGLDEMFHNDRGTREDEDREMEMTQGGAKAVLRGAANVLAGLPGPCIPIEPMSYDESLAEERRVAERNRAALVEGPGEQRPMPSIDNSLNNAHLPSSRLPLIEDSSVSTGGSSSTGVLDGSVNSLESFRRQQRAAAEHSERMAELDHSRNLRIVGQLDSSHGGAGGGGGRAMDSSGGFQFGRVGLDSSRNSTAGGGGGGRTMNSSGSSQFGRQLDSSRNSGNGGRPMDSSGGFQFGRNGGGGGGRAMDSSGGYHFGRVGQTDSNRNGSAGATGAFRTGGSTSGGVQFGRSAPDSAATDKRASEVAASIDRPTGASIVAPVPMLSANSGSSSSPGAFGSIDFSTLQKQQLLASAASLRASTPSPPPPPRNHGCAEETAPQPAAPSSPQKKSVVEVRGLPGPSTPSRKMEVDETSEAAAAPQADASSSSALSTALTTQISTSKDSSDLAGTSELSSPEAATIVPTETETGATGAGKSREGDVPILVFAPSRDPPSSTEIDAVAAMDEGGSLSFGTSTEAPTATAAPKVTEAQWRSLFSEELARVGGTTLDKSSFVAVAAAALALGQSDSSAALASAHDLDAAFTLADEDKSGNVDEEEFVALMKLVDAGLVEGLGGSVFNPFNWGKEDKFKAATTKPAP